MLNRRVILLSLAFVAVVVALVKDPVARNGFRSDPEPKITFMAVGDVLLDRGIADRIARHGMDWPFEGVGEALRSADLAFCNLECPLSETGIKINKPYCFRAHPSTVKCLVDAGFDIVSLANNHSMDCSRQGLVDTMRCLDDAGIAHTGTADTLQDSLNPTILEIDGLKIVFLVRNALYPEGIWLRPEQPNVAPLDPDRILDQIKRAKRRADVVIVSLHWGIEYRKHPTENQTELARKMIDAGADLILGHHPHVVQPVEEYNGGVIAYSLGNFLFDSPYPQCRESVILKCSLSRQGVTDLELLPVKLENCRPIFKKIGLLPLLVHIPDFGPNG